MTKKGNANFRIPTKKREKRNKKMIQIVEPKDNDLTKSRRRPLNSDQLAAFNKKYLHQMKSAISDWRTEEAHSYMDWVLCEILEELGFEEILELYRGRDKWYA